MISTAALNGAVAGDDVALSGGTATFDTAAVGNNKTVTATGFTLSGTSATNYTLSPTTCHDYRQYHCQASYGYRPDRRQQDLRRYHRGHCHRDRRPVRGDRPGRRDPTGHAELRLRQQERRRR